MRLLLDSNIITYVLQERTPVLARLTEALNAGAAFVVADVVDYEVRRYLLLKGASRQLRRYEALIEDWTSSSLVQADWHSAAEIWAELHRAGASIEDRDLLIAVTAMKEEATLVTNNLRHFEQLGLPLENWAEADPPARFDSETPP